MIQFLFVLVFTGSIAHSLEIPPEKLLRDKLASESNPLIRPVLNHTDRLTVYFRFKLLKIADMVGTSNKIYFQTYHTQYCEINFTIL